MWRGAVWLAVVLALGLGLGSPMAGQATSHDPAASAGPRAAMQRVEVPAHGIAFVLPDGWTWVVLDIYRGAAPFAGVFAQSPSGNARCGSSKKPAAAQIVRLVRFHRRRSFWYTTRIIVG